MSLGAASRVAVALAFAVAAVAQESRGFGRVLWLPQEAAADPARLRRVAEAGFTGVQLGPGADPKPVRAAGLSFYFDQPIGKGYFELRDDEYEPLRAAYERDRDPRALVRRQCLRDPTLSQELGVRAATAAAAIGKDGMLFCALADEASATRHDNPLDLCRCGNCLLQFRSWLERRHGSIAALNLAWGAEFADFAAVEPLTTDQIRRRELGGVLLPGNLRPWSEWLEFVDEGYAAAVAFVRQQVQRELPGVPVGLTGLQVPAAFGGNDYARLLPGLSLVEPYDVGAAPRLARALLPDAACWSTMVLPVGDDPQFESRAIALLCEQAAMGSAGVVVWNEPAMFGADGTVKPAGRALQKAWQRLQPALDACAGSKLLRAPVWIVESQSSVRAWWMLDSAGDGMTWPRRLQSHEATHSTSIAARSSTWQLLADLGITAAAVDERQLPERLLQERPRLLVLPATIALADRACRAIAAYVQTGGAVLADHDAALYDADLVLRDRGGLDDLFGITARSRRWTDLGVVEGHAREPKTLLADGSLRAQLAERRGDGVVFVEARPEHGKGRAVCLNLAVAEYDRIRLDEARVDLAVDLRRRVRQVLSAAELQPPCDVRGDGLPTCIERTELRARDGRTILAVRLAATSAPELLARLGKDGPRKVRLSFPRAVTLRELGGRDLGTGTAFDLQLDVHAGLFVEIAR